MKDKDLTLEETEVSHTLGGTIKYTEYINLVGVVIGLVVLCGPKEKDVVYYESRK
jgi:hypothetical protein